MLTSSNEIIKVINVESLFSFRLMASVCLSVPLTANGQKTDPGSAREGK